MYMCGIIYCIYLTRYGKRRLRYYIVIKISMFYVCGLQCFVYNCYICLSTIVYIYFQLFKLTLRLTASAFQQFVCSFFFKIFYIQSLRL